MLLFVMFGGIAQFDGGDNTCKKEKDRIIEKVAATVWESLSKV